MNKVRLKRCGLEVSSFGLGTLTLGGSQLRLSFDLGAEIVCHAIEKGINLFDTAEYYKTYEYLRRGFRLAEERLPGFKAEDMTVVSKSYARSYDEMLSAIEDAREALGRERIEIFLLHELRSKDDFNSREGAWQALKDAKKRGHVKGIGLSTHHVDVCEMAAGIEELDLVFTLINRRSMGIRRGNEASTKEEMLKAIRACRADGKDIFSMKVFGGGNLAGEYQASLKYILSIPEISSRMVGFSSNKEIDELCDFLEGNMAPGYQPDTKHKKIMVDQSDCEGCGSCKAVCPQGAISWNSRGLAEIDTKLCITCGYCAYACPVRAIIML